MIGLMTVASKDGKIKLDEPFYATNKRYIEVHHTWDWKEITYEQAAREISEQNIK